MRVAIAGAGVAGGYLAALLHDQGLSPEVFDPAGHGTRCGCRSCGWGAPARIGPYLVAVGLDPDAYVLETMPTMHFDELVAHTPFRTIDKPRLVRELVRDVRVHGRTLAPDEAAGYDVVVDATGLARAFLPPCASDLTLPTLQHRVAAEPLAGDRLEAGVYGYDVPGLGYVWVFPLGGGEYHIGVGGIGLESLEHVLERFYRGMDDRFACTRRCACTGAVRVASPYHSRPLYTQAARSDGPPRLIVGVGEAIGAVAPFTAEGILYSLESARLLAAHLCAPERYARRVLARFAWMRRQRETLDHLLAHREPDAPRVRDRWRFYRSARRAGIGLPMTEAFRQLGSLSRWIDAGGERAGARNARPGAPVHEAPSRSAPGSDGGDTAVVAITLVMRNLAFDPAEIAVPAGSQVELTCENRDAGVPHTFSLYSDATAGTRLFAGGATIGPETVTYRFTAPPERGRFFFRCDVHPGTMTGAFVTT